MIELLSIVMLVFGILQVILFFKIWGMTNDVNEIKLVFKDYVKSKNANQSELASKSEIKVGDLVVELKNERQLKVKNITESGKFECSVAGSTIDAGTFSSDEIELFDKYWNKSK